MLHQNGPKRVYLSFVDTSKLRLEAIQISSDTRRGRGCGLPFHAVGGGVWGFGVGMILSAVSKLHS